MQLMGKGLPFISMHGAQAMQPSAGHRVVFRTKDGQLHAGETVATTDGSQGTSSVGFYVAELNKLFLGHEVDVWQLDE